MIFNLKDDKNSGKITGFTYSRSLNELVGNWSAEAVGGTFKAGSSISFDNVMTDGIITRAYKDSSGLWHIEGKDAGIKLMKSTPDIADLPNGDAQNVISYIANYCGIPLTMTGNGLSGFNVRSVISGSTCAEAILELCMLSGYVAYINNNGVLCIVTPNSSVGSFSNIIDDSGSDIDLDGYATHVLVNLTRKKYDEKENSSGSGSSVTHWTGKTPPARPTRETITGSFDGGSYSYTILQPFNVIEEAETRITKDNVTVTTVENHNYEYDSKVIERGNQEYRLFWFAEESYDLRKYVEGTYPVTVAKTVTTTTEGGSTTQTTSYETSNETFKETTIEVFERKFGYSDATYAGIPSDWEGEINMVSKETLERTTTRTGGKAVKDDMPDYAPPFDTQITRNFERGRNGRSLSCNELEINYEARQVGSISPVKVNNQLVPHFLMNSKLVIETHGTPKWVPIKTYRAYVDNYDENGDCSVSTKSEYCDDGSEWLCENSIIDTGDDELNDYEKSYAKFSQLASGLEINIGQSSLASPYTFIEVQGRMKSEETDTEGVALGNISEWYDNGEFSVDTCPFYNTTTKQCNVYEFAYSSKTGCDYRKGTHPGWKSYCPRVQAALQKALEQDASQIDAPIIGTASKSASAKVGYQRDIYIDENINDSTAQSIANTIASNILSVKSTKGIKKTVVIPYDSTYIPNGAIVSVSHDWANMQTSVSYLDDGDIPEFLISESVAGIASFVSARENARQSNPKYGTVISCSSGQAVVKVGNSNIQCTTKLKNLHNTDIVLVSFPAGNKLKGQVIARL